MLIAYVLSLLLLVWGAIYTVRIALRPFPVGKTWQSVVLGDATTAAGMSGLIALFGYEFGLGFYQVAVLAAIPWWCLALTGLPMIGGQIVKHELRVRDAQAHAIEDMDDGDA